MKQLKTPRGLPVDVPESVDEDVSLKFDISQTAEIKAYFESNGYVIVRGAIEPAICNQIRSLWDLEVKPFEGSIYRQATARLERHKFNDKGWVMNPILNLQSVDPRHFPGFREFATQQVLSHSNLTQGFRILLGDTPKLVQSMYFEGNSATWEHQDSYYLDSENLGAMVAGWIAVEDIAAEAGRFFICPKSHQIELIRQQKDNNIADNHDAYIQQVVERIRALSLEIRAPLLQQGDILFWHAFTIHGSLDSQDENRSRSSITCHAIPNSHRFLQLHSRVLDLPTDSVNGTRVFRPKDLSRWMNRLIFSLESNFPNFFSSLKKMAVRHAIKSKAAR
jgi:phytanoyl-CoA hydroxylase